MREDFCYRLYQYLIRSTFIRCNQYPLFNSSGVVSYVNCSSDYVRLDVHTMYTVFVSKIDLPIFLEYFIKYS